MVLVYAATGYTGTLICEELDRQGTPFAVAGRDRARLEALSGRLSSHPRVLVADVSDPGGLRAMAREARVVLSCAGPFVEMGRPVQDAALEAGAHWLDVTGEYPFLLATWARDEEAKARGVALVNAVGVEVVPSEVAAALACEGMRPASLRLAMAGSGGASRGTSLSTLGVVAQGGVVWEAGALRPEPLAARAWDAPFPPPLGTRPCVSVPLADALAAARSTGAPACAGFQPLGAGPTVLARRAPFLLRAAGLLRPLARLAQPGPSRERRASSRTSVVVEARGEAGERRTVGVTGGNGYDVTARIAARCARLAAGPGFSARGALTPVQAFGAAVLREGLEQAGLRFTVEGS